MQALYANGSATLLILAAMAAEAILLTLLFRRTGQGIPPSSLLPGIAAGAALVGAAGLALRSTPWPWIALLLLGAGALHALDLHNRWQRPTRTSR